MLRVLPSPSTPPRPRTASNEPFRADLVWDARLSTDFLPNGVIRHTHFRSNSAKGQRRARHVDKWTTRMKVGEGGFGRVWYQINETGEVRALKEIRKDVAPAPVDYRRELEAAFKFSHAKYVHCFVESFGWFEDEKNVYISMEYLQHGDLRNVLNAAALSEEETQIVARQLVEGLELMHSNHFVHRDLKPANILVVQPGPHWWVKLADFGISKRAYEATALRTSIGTEGYCAPEILIGSMSALHNSQEKDEDVYTAAVDMWALGEVLYRSLTQQPAFPSRRDMYLFVTKQRPLNEKPLVDRAVSESCREFVNGLLAAIPDERYTAELATSHRWIKLPGTEVHPASTSPHEGHGHQVAEQISEPALQWMLSPAVQSSAPSSATASWTTQANIGWRPSMGPGPSAIGSPLGVLAEQLDPIQQGLEAAGLGGRSSRQIELEPEWHTAYSQQDGDSTPRPDRRAQSRAIYPVGIEQKSLSPPPLNRSPMPSRTNAADPQREAFQRQINLLTEQLADARRERERFEKTVRQQMEATQEENRLVKERLEAAIRAEEEEKERIRAQEETARREAIEQGRRDAERRAEQERKEKERKEIEDKVRDEIRRKEKEEWMSKSKGERALLRWITKRDPTQ